MSRSRGLLTSGLLRVRNPPTPTPRTLTRQSRAFARARTSLGIGMHRHMPPSLRMAQWAAAIGAQGGTHAEAAAAGASLH